MVESLAPRRTFLVEAEPEHDVLLRVLAPFAVQGAPILSLEAEQAAALTVIRLEVGGLDHALAERLAEKLRALPIIRSVGLGWRVALAA